MTSTGAGPTDGIYRSLEQPNAFYPFLTWPSHHAPMPDFPFDATITIDPHHLAAAGLDPGQRLDAIVEAVRGAVQRMEGADWIDVAAASFPSTCPGWVTLYPPGSSVTPDTPSWHERRHEVEEAVKAALVTAAVPR